VVESVRNHLLTPYGLRTLSPRAQAYQGRYEGGPDQRDAAYHQGTVWPWLLGSYAEALLKTAWDVDGAVHALLTTVTPLFSGHLADAGLGALSEIFDGDPPHAPNGCIAQAWSTAECCRMLRLLEKAAPKVYAEWESRLAGR
jgi:glycogen debranching enzyme